MGIPIKGEEIRRWEMRTALKALRERGWRLSVFSPGENVNGHLLDQWRVTLSHPGEGWSVTVSGASEDRARIAACDNALGYHGLHIGGETVDVSA